MVKLECKINDLDYLQNLGDNLKTRSRFNLAIRENYTTNDLTKCYNSFNYELLNGNFYIGFCPNWIKSPQERERIVVLDFNPNKVSISDVPELHGFLTRCDKIVVKTLDIACDYIGLNICDVHYVKWHASVLERPWIRGGLDSVTFGAVKERHNKIKLYNKKYEMKLPLDSEEWTRYELTVRLNIEYSMLRYVSDLGVKLVEIYDKRTPDNFFNTVTGTDRVLVEACIMKPDLLNCLSRDKKKKIKSLVGSLLNPLTPDSSCLVSVVNNFVLH